MTMFYPILRGFWTSTGVSSAVLLMLFYCHEHIRHPSLPPWINAPISLLVYAAPLIGTWYLWKRFDNKNRWKYTVRPLMRDCLTGSVIGAVVVFIVATLLLPVLT